MHPLQPVAVVTGASDGIGFETAVGLAIRGFEVVCACRSFGKGNEAVMKINDLVRQYGKFPGREYLGHASFAELDLSDLSSVKDFVEGYKRRFTRCNVLVCNAGTFTWKPAATADGFETQFQVNYLGHAALVSVMLPYLQAAAKPLPGMEDSDEPFIPPRVVCVTSKLHEKELYQTGDFAKWTGVPARDYKPMRAYGMSKLFVVAFVKAMQERWSRLGLEFHAVHPGLVKTKILGAGMPWYLRALMAPAFGVLALSGRLKNVREGASTSLFVCLEPHIKGGTYWALKAPRAPNPLLEEAGLVEEIFTQTTAILDPQGFALRPVQA